MSGLVESEWLAGDRESLNMPCIRELGASKWFKAGALFLGLRSGFLLFLPFAFTFDAACPEDIN